MNMTAEVVTGLSKTSPAEYSVPLRPCVTGPDAASATSSSSSADTSPQHVEFRVTGADDVNVNEKVTRGRFLTAKYPKHQMGLIRRRLNVEDWIDEELKVLFDVSDEDYDTYDAVIELDEVLNLDTDPERTAYILERISHAPKPDAVKNKFISDLLEKAATL